MFSLDVQNRDLLEVQGGQPRRPEQRSSRGTGWEEVHGGQSSRPEQRSSRGTGGEDVHGGQPRRPEQRWYRVQAEIYYSYWVVILDVQAEIY